LNLVIFSVALGPPPANAATAACGLSCVDLFNAPLGTADQPNFLIAAGGDSVGSPIVLSTASNTNPAEDFVLEAVEPVSTFYQVGLVSPAIDQDYGSLDAFELEYAPFGDDAGLCVGVGTTPTNFSAVALEDCGISGRTLWIADPTLSSTPAPLISAVSTDAAEPQVLTGYTPLLQSLVQLAFGSTVQPHLYTLSLIDFRSHVATTQLWGADMGLVR
jgi:hypothetical protein